MEKRYIEPEEPNPFIEDGSGKLVSLADCNQVEEKEQRHKELRPEKGSDLSGKDAWDSIAGMKSSDHNSPVVFEKEEGMVTDKSPGVAIPEMTTASPIKKDSDMWHTPHSSAQVKE